MVVWMRMICEDPTMGNDPLFKALTMSLLLYYVDYLLFPIMGGFG